MKLSLLSPCLKTEDLGRTVEFYTQLLGFRVETLWPEEDPTFAVLDHGPSEHEVSVSLMFYADEMIEGEGEPLLTGQLTMDVDDVLALHRRLRGEVEVLWGPEDYHYGRTEFSVLDPNGYRLVFTTPTAEVVSTLEAQAEAAGESNSEATESEADSADSTLDESGGSD